MIGETVENREKLEKEKQKEEREKLWRNGTTNLLRKRNLKGKMKYKDRNRIEEKLTERKPWRKARRRAPETQIQEKRRNRQ